MKWMGSQSFLGIAVGERAMTVAEIAATRGGEWEVRRAAEYVPAAEEAASGAAFGRFLREYGFAARLAVVGVPARWIVSREREMPPSSPQQTAEVLRLQAERVFSAELGELAVDYAGTTDNSSARSVLLIAMPKAQLDRVVKLVEEAGREVAAVMPTTLALAGAGETNARDEMVLNVSDDAVELTGHRDGAPRVLRHLPVRGSDLASQNGTRAVAMTSLAGEIRRIVAMMPRGASASATAPRMLQVWDTIGLDAPETASLAQQAGMELRSVEGAFASLAAGSTEITRRFAPALALALAGASPRAGTADFLHPRLAVAKQRRIGRREAWAIGIVGGLVLAMLVFWLDVRRRESNLADLKFQLDQAAPKVQAAEKTQQLITTARAWYPEGRPASLDCLREITEAFPDGGEAIYVTKFSLPESRQGQLLGRTPDQTLVLDLVDRLNKNRNFANVKSNFMLNAGGNSNEIAFSISFIYPAPGSAAARTQP
jgi:hypothetical protein